MKTPIKALAAGVALATAFAAAPAQAQYFGGGPGVPYYQPGLPPPPYGYGRPPAPGWGQPPGYGPISCGEGAQIIASQGFRRISVRECGGRVYRYTAFRRGAPFEVRVSSSTGQITMVRPI